jgi:hypothetical protein
MFSLRSQRFFRFPDTPPASSGDDARRECARFLARARVAERASDLTAGLARVAALGFVALGLALVADFFFEPSGGTRGLLAGAWLVPTLAGAGVVLARACLLRPSERWLAQRAEARWAALDGRLLAVTTYRGRPSVAVDALAPGVARDLARVRARGIPDVARLRRWLLAALGACALASLVVAGYAAVAPDRLGRALALESEPGPSGSTRILAVRPGAARVIEGRGLPIEVGVSGEPSEAAVLVRPRGAAERESLRVRLERRAWGRFVASLPPFLEEASYRVVIDGVSSAEFPVALIRAPRIVAVDHHEEYPAYLELPGRDVPGGSIDTFAGTRVLVRATTSSEPLRGSIRATWTEDGLLETIPLAIAGPRTLETSFSVERTGTFTIAYDDATGLPPRPSAVFTVTVRPDLPPRVQVLEPSGDREVPFAGELEVVYEARDDHALGDLALHLVVHGGKPKKLPLPLGSDPRYVQGKLRLSPKDLGLLPGDSAIYYLVAQDRKAPSPNRTMSAPYVLAVEDDARLREELTGLDMHDEEILRSVESSSGTPEGDADLARNQDALRRLERILAREPGAEGPEAADVLKELTPDDLDDVSRALEDLEQDEDSVLLPQEADCPDCDKIAKNSGVCPRCGRVNRCGSCGKPGHGRGCLAPPPANGGAENGEAGKHGPPGPGRRGEQTREAIEGARRSFITRVGTSRALTRLYREILDRRRELLRRLADQLAKGALPPEALAKLGPDTLRVLDAFRNAGEKSRDAGSPLSAKRSGRVPAVPGRALRVRPDIPDDAVRLEARSENSPRADSTPEPSRAPAWDEALPEELRAIVKAYFRRAQ